MYNLEKLKDEPWFIRLGQEDKFGEDLQGDCINFINSLNQRDWKIQVYAIGNNGDGYVQDLGLYEDFEGIKIHTNLFKDVVIELEQVFDKLDK